jgi:hypothetical protein
VNRRLFNRDPEEIVEKRELHFWYAEFEPHRSKPAFSAGFSTISVGERVV